MHFILQINQYIRYLGFKDVNQLNIIKYTTEKYMVGSAKSQKNNNCRDSNQASGYPR